jgi:protease-4
MSPQLRDYLQSMVEHGYEQFLSHVAEGRNRSRDEIHAIAQGRVWAGTDAHRIGLVDTLGTFEDAVKSAARRANLGDDYVIDRREPSLSWAQELALQIRMQAARFSGSLLKRDGDLAELRRLVAPLRDETLRFLATAQPNKTYAYCLCTVP